MYDAQLIEHQIFFAASCLNFLYNYFDRPTKLFPDLHLAKLLDILAKSFFPCIDPVNKCVTDFDVGFGESAWRF